ncbi:MAG: lyase family protein [Bacteroidales bacterium]|jgi:aspartate ammonia-lyase|nr:lyase family protein [Bacteroidales bacterium]
MVQTQPKDSFRTEKDFLGEQQIPANALYGIHSVRAKENFPDNTPFSFDWYKAIGITKLACYLTYDKFKKAIFEKYPKKQLPITLMDQSILDALMESAEEVSGGKHFDHFIVPAIQGGAGTSINMNVNEIIANVALTKLGKNPGDDHTIDPIEHANIYQSTNDIIPTSLKVAGIKLLTDLEETINELRFDLEKLENRYRNHLRMGYTQMQEAVPSSYAMLFSSYNEALSRDWWRVSKCFERIKMVNLGGSAIGTGLGIPRFFIMEATPTLQKLTNLPITRSENMPDATSNLDSLVEVHAILKSHAVNLEKMVSDIRLLASDVSGNRELSIPRKQVGSSIMPGKVNPVIPEFVISAAHQIYANDQLISSLSAQGCLDLNAYLPVIGHALLGSINLLIASNKTLKNNLFNELTIDTQKAGERLYQSPALTTALGPHIGYHQAGELAKTMKQSGLDIFQANEKLQLMDTRKLKIILQPQNLLKMGFTVNDILE